MEIAAGRCNRQRRWRGQNYGVSYADPVGAAVRRCSQQDVVVQEQSRHRPAAIAVRITAIAISFGRGEAVQHHEIATTRVDGKHGAAPVRAPGIGCSVQRITRDNQIALRLAAGLGIIEIANDIEAGAVGVDPGDNTLGAIRLCLIRVAKLAYARLVCLGEPTDSHEQSSYEQSRFRRLHDTCRSRKPRLFWHNGSGHAAYLPHVHFPKRQLGRL